MVHSGAGLIPTLLVLFTLTSSLHAVKPTRDTHFGSPASLDDWTFMSSAESVRKLCGSRFATPSGGVLRQSSVSFRQSPSHQKARWPSMCDFVPASIYRAWMEVRMSRYRVVAYCSHPKHLVTGSAFRDLQIY